MSGQVRGLPYKSEGTLRTRKGDRVVRPQRGECGRITLAAPHDRVKRNRLLT
ncbi:hypothetical protein [Rhodopila globiformis]|uniref:hypothetical protein n=1 Tax=Rhodopila globiformis TaxID=1071 RepID=UPI0013048A1E|nr:hypothetical protein [Rhodopila globiformis]